MPERIVQIVALSILWLQFMIIICNVCNLNAQDYNAKLSDFGLAKDGPVGDKSHVSTRIMGTYGYAAPEYIMTGTYLTLMDKFVRITS